MARKNIAYIGGGGTRGPGTMASFIHQGANFAGSRIIVMDKSPHRLPLVEKLARKMVSEQGIDLQIETTTSLEAALTDADAVLTSYRPGGFEARHRDESIPLKYDIIGNETQGPGGFFMALRSINDMKEICRVMERRANPGAIMFNYTNPVNIVSQAVSMYTDIEVYSFCEGPLVFAPCFCDWWGMGLDRSKLDYVMVGLNHAGWTVRHLYEGESIIPMLKEKLDVLSKDSHQDQDELRLLRLAVAMESLPAHYYDWYYFHDLMLRRQKAKCTTRAQDILAHVPDYWRHYQEQAETSARSELDPQRSRGGIHELELAIDAMDAVFNNRNEVLPVNIPNRGTIADFPDDLVVEVPALVNSRGFAPVLEPFTEPGAPGVVALDHCPASVRGGRYHMPHQTRGLVQALGEYQWLTAKAAWEGNRMDGIRALCSNPLVRELDKATRVYDEMAHALRKLLPARLLKD